MARYSRRQTLRGAELRLPDHSGRNFVSETVLQANIHADIEHFFSKIFVIGYV